MGQVIAPSTVWGKGCSSINAQAGSALQTASFHGDVKIVQLLLDAGADIYVQGGGYGSALQAASYNGQMEIVKLLLDSGFDIDTHPELYCNALEAASNQGHLEIVQLLLNSGAADDLVAQFRSGGLGVKQQRTEGWLK